MGKERDDVFENFLDKMAEHYGKNTLKFSLPKREKEINEFLVQLKRLWMLCPKQRFGQVLYNCTKMGTPVSKKEGPSYGIKDFFYYEDNDILEGIKENIKKLNKKG